MSFQLVVKIFVRMMKKPAVPLLAVATAAAAVATVVAPKQFDPSGKDLVVFGAVGMGLFVAAMISYLGDSRMDISADTHALRHLFREVGELRKQQSLLAPEYKAELVRSLRDGIETDAVEHLITEVRDQVLKNEISTSVAERSKGTLARIYAEIDALGRRGNINLALGIVTAMTGVAALSMFVIFDTQQHETLAGFAIAFLPRLSIVVIIEVFSYFFLRLYKTSLAEIKYFQNEATNIEYNFVALEAALLKSDDELIRRSLARFIEVERNPVLSKSSTTGELLANKTAANSLHFTPDHLVEILKAVSGKHEPAP